MAGQRLPYLFAGDRQVAVTGLERLIELGDRPDVLCTASTPTATHASELEEVFRAAGGTHVVRGHELHGLEARHRLSARGLQLAVAVQFPHLVRPEVLGIPDRGWVNVHPAYLPYNRGWNTPSWAILEGSPAGVTIHEMAPEVDAGRIIARRQVEVRPSDTADGLYQRLLEAEVELLLETWPRLRADTMWNAQEQQEGTLHRRGELCSDAIQLLDLDAALPPRELLDRLRALTTNRWDESARFVVDGQTYRLRIEIRHDPDASRGTAADDRP